MRKIYFLVEEKSMKVFIRETESILRELARLRNCSMRPISFRGKNELKQGIAADILARDDGRAAFVVLCDQDDNDCVKLKREIAREIQKSGAAGRALVRIVCRELESWLLGEKGIAKPDAISNPKSVLKQKIGYLSAPDAARRIAVKMTLESAQRNPSRSFQNFLSGLEKLCR